jgi:hypothetical protein
MERRLLDLLGEGALGMYRDDAHLLADDPQAWPGEAAALIRRARTAYDAGQLEKAAELVLEAQRAIERDRR